MSCYETPNIRASKRPGNRTCLLLGPCFDAGLRVLTASTDVAWPQREAHSSSFHSSALHRGRLTLHLFHKENACGLNLFYSMRQHLTGWKSKLSFDMSVWIDKGSKKSRFMGFYHSLFYRSRLFQKFKIASANKHFIYPVGKSSDPNTTLFDIESVCSPLSSYYLPGKLPCPNKYLVLVEWMNESYRHWYQALTYAIDSQNVWSSLEVDCKLIIFPAELWVELLKILSNSIEKENQRLFL